jgi:hypothetical protein
MMQTDNDKLTNYRVNTRLSGQYAVPWHAEMPRYNCRSTQCWQYLIISRVYCSSTFGCLQEPAAAAPVPHLQRLRTASSL